MKTSKNQPGGALDHEEKLRFIREAGELKDKNAVDLLTEMIRNEKELLCDIIWALGKIADPNSTDAVLKFLVHDDWQVRGASAEAIGEIGGGDEIVKLLIEMLNDKSDHVHWKAAWSLGNIGNVSAVDTLNKMLSEEDPQKCWHYVWALGQIGDRRAIKPLVSKLEKSSDINLRRNIAYALKNIHEPQSIEIFKQLLEDRDSEVRHYANEAIISFQDQI